MPAGRGLAKVDVAIWLSFVCYAVHRLHKTRSVSSYALTAVAFAMPVLAGHPEMAAHLTLTGVALALVLWIFVPGADGSRFDWRFPAGFALAGILALGLASVQMI